MKFIKLPVLLLSILLFVSTASAQKTQITISFNEQFFDALLDALFVYAAPPEFPLARTQSDRPSRANEANAFAPAAACNESIKLLRENNGKRTSVRFREGKITAPI